MTPEKAIQALELLRIFDAPPLREAANMAIAALRAQQEPVKLDRSRWKGCFSCSQKLCTTCKYSSLNILSEPCRSCSDDHNFYDQMNFCPVCGKPLTEEAWSELERRIGGNDEAD